MLDSPLEKCGLKGEFGKRALTTAASKSKAATRRADPAGSALPAGLGARGRDAWHCGRRGKILISPDPQRQKERTYGVDGKS